ncbi:MAG: DUF5615 family PIN-like protein [Bacteroidales bacterium]|nr:DUF5615 family PIN-like protein [Bacteroidales bacterium]
MPDFAMKLLFDENISFRIVKKISDIFPDSAHVSKFGLLKSNDLQIWDFAKRNSFTIVTNDSDFNDILSIYSHLPKVIWYRGGNKTTQILAEKLLENQDEVISFLQDLEK